jgi:hypothetical protein
VVARRDQRRRANHQGWLRIGCSNIVVVHCVEDTPSVAQDRRRFG